ncbi:hypothetical protein DPMN_128405 [Dreissena polymorpha]|uniref:Uncharacterized protein n=1 Tax=Dreissena polymorpha TaxID=45954 RepID=A0A9D4H3V2_DREPO|nr:hypothetical protein DPMN_128405 [Dreissena polymorpha]
MSRVCRENVVCRPSSTTLDILATFSRRTTNQSTVNMIYRENVDCRPKNHSTFSRRTTFSRHSIRYIEPISRNCRHTTFSRRSLDARRISRLRNPDRPSRHTTFSRHSLDALSTRDNHATINI